MDSYTSRMDNLNWPPPKSSIWLSTLYEAQQSASSNTGQTIKTIQTMIRLERFQVWWSYGVIAWNHHDFKKLRAIENGLDRFARSYYWTNLVTTISYVSQGPDIKTWDLIETKIIFQSNINQLVIDIASVSTISIWHATRPTRMSWASSLSWEHSTMAQHCSKSKIQTVMQSYEILKPLLPKSRLRSPGLHNRLSMRVYDQATQAPSAWLHGPVICHPIDCSE